MTRPCYWIEADGRTIPLCEDRANALTAFRAIVNVSHGVVSLCKETAISDRCVILCHIPKCTPQHRSRHTGLMWRARLMPQIYDPADRKYLERIEACFSAINWTWRAAA